jgi:hypothetical protein
VCAAEAGYGKPVPADMHSPSQHEALAQETAAYKAKVSGCKKLLGIDEQTICVSRAGNDASLASTLG